MSKKLLNIVLLAAFQVGYLEWGKGNHIFIFEVEKDIFNHAAAAPEGLLHPFILIPFAGMILLLITLFQPVPSRKLTLIGLACLSILVLFLFFIGLVSFNAKMLLASIPFIVTGIIILKNKKTVNES